jgi:paraquat-inducible protein B
MSKQANKTIIGGFVVGAVALLFAGILVFGSGKFFKRTYKFVLFFEGSVKGLSVGAPVVFRGVQIGSVESVVIRADAEDMTVQIPVIIEFEPDRLEIKKGKADPRRNMPLLIERGLRAQLQIQSLVTGQLMIELDFQPDEPVRLVGTETEYMAIPTIPSTFEQITSKVEKLPVEEMFNKLSLAISGIEEIVNSDDTREMVRYLRLAAEDADKLIRDLDDQVKPLSGTIDETLKDYGKLARHIDGQVEPLASDISGTVKDYGKLAHVVNDRVIY